MLSDVTPCSQISELTARPIKSNALGAQIAAATQAGIVMGNISR
jgi:hypothetical protein